MGELTTSAGHRAEHCKSHLALPLSGSFERNEVLHESCRILFQVQLQRIVDGGDTI